MPRETDQAPYEWTQDEHTLRLLKQWRSVRHDTLGNLRASAKRSADPEVRSDEAELRMCDRFIAQLTGRLGDSSEEEQSNV